ncbi:arginase family protein, partial [Acidobacteriota bacterium]
LLGYRSATTESLHFLEKNESSSAWDAASIRGGETDTGKLLQGLEGNVWLTVDVNVFSPALMPVSSNPEPGGLGWEEVIALIRAVFLRSNVLGCDLVGFVPCPGLTTPEQLASRLVIKLIAYRLYPDKISSKKPLTAP